MQSFERYIRWTFYIPVVSTFFAFTGDCAVVGHEGFTDSVDTSDFKQMVERKMIMVDKSHFIKEVMEDGSACNLITRPRRFGKTLNLSMLKYFLTNTENTSTLFDKFVIAKDRQFCAAHQNKHPVIYLDFSLMRNETVEKNIASFRAVISKAYSDHKYLEHSDHMSEHDREDFLCHLNQEVCDEVHLPYAIEDLMECLKDYHKKSSVVLVDHYDVPITNDFHRGFNGSIASRIETTFISIFKGAFFSRGIIMGVSDVIQRSLFSSFNNADTITIVDRKYSEHFGFLETEVEELLLRSGTNKIHKLEEVRRYYGGYHMGPLVMYNPKSVMMYTTEKVLKGFWVDSRWSKEFDELLGGHGALPILKAQMLVDGIKLWQNFVTQLNYAKVGKDDDTSWSLVTQLGYLTFNSIDGYRTNHEFVDLQIPNHEVRLEFDRFLGTARALVAHLPSYSKFVQSFERNDTHFASSALSTYLSEFKKCFSFHYDSRIVLGLLRGLEKLYGPTTDSVFQDYWKDFSALIMEDRAQVSKNISRTLIVVKKEMEWNDKSIKHFSECVIDKVAEHFPKKTDMHFTRTLIVYLSYSKMAPHIKIFYE